MVPERRLTPVWVPRPLRKTFARKSVESQGAILGCVRQLREDWRRQGLRTKQLQGRIAPNGEPVYEARVTRGDRVTFYWDGHVLVIENHCTHKNVLGR